MGLEVGIFIGIVVAILIVNVVGVIGYRNYKAKNPDRAMSINLNPDLVPKLRYGLLGLLSLSMIFSIACTSACTFVKVQTASKGYFSYNYESYFGLRGSEYDGVCVAGDIPEPRLRTAFAFGVLNNLLTAIALIGCFLVVFGKIEDANKANQIWKIMGFLVLASTWCCLFTFYIQETPFCDGIGIFKETECSLAGAGVAQVFNVIFLIAICVLFFILPSPKATGGDDDATNSNNRKSESTKSNKDEDVEIADNQQPSI